MKCVWVGSPRRLATGLICNVMLIYLLLPCQVSPEPAIDYYRVKREAEETERDSSAEFTLLNTVSHTQAVLMHCHVPELYETAVLLLVNVTFTSVRNSISEGMSPLTFTRCLQKESAASSVSALHCTSMQSGAGKLLLHLRGDTTGQVQQCIYMHDSANLVYLDHLIYLHTASTLIYSTQNAQHTATAGQIINCCLLRIIRQISYIYFCLSLD